MSSTLIDAGGLLILPRLQVQNANAISGPLTWGFPSPTAFTGFTHALERRLSGDSSNDFGKLQQGFGGVGIICHGFEPQVAKPAGRYCQVFRLTRNPVGRDGKATALVEEGRIHLEVSLVIVVKDNFGQSDGKDFARAAHHIVQGMRLAGGSILPARAGNGHDAYWLVLPDALDEQRDLFSKLCRRLLPGYALVQREDLLAERLAEIRVHQTDATALDALLALSRLNIEPIVLDSDRPEDVEWRISKHPGWLVPLPIGYAAVSPLYPPGTVRNTRDGETPFRFVESLYSLGQWVSPHRMTELQQLLWQLETDPQAGLYRCINRYSDSIPTVTANIA